MLKERNPNTLYRSHIIKYDGNRVAMFMRVKPDSRNMHIHWYCSPTTARAIYRTIKAQADAGNANAQRIIAQILNMRSVSFDTTINALKKWQPAANMRAEMFIKWEKTWPTSKYRADTGPRPAPKHVQPETNRQVLINGDWFAYADTTERDGQYDTPHLQVLNA